MAAASATVERMRVIDPHRRTEAHRSEWQARSMCRGRSSFDLDATTATITPRALRGRRRPGRPSRARKMRTQGRRWRDCPLRHGRAGRKAGAAGSMSPIRIRDSPRGRWRRRLRRPRPRCRHRSAVPPHPEPVVAVPSVARPAPTEKPPVWKRRWSAEPGRHRTFLARRRRQATVGDRDRRRSDRSAESLMPSSRSFSRRCPRNLAQEPLVTEPLVVEPHP